MQVVPQTAAMLAEVVASRGRCFFLGSDSGNLPRTAGKNKLPRTLITPGSPKAHTELAKFAEQISRPQLGRHIGALRFGFKPTEIAGSGAHPTTLASS